MQSTILVARIFAVMLLVAPQPVGVCSATGSASGIQETRRRWPSWIASATPHGARSKIIWPESTGEVLIVVAGGPASGSWGS